MERNTEKRKREENDDDQEELAKKLKTEEPLNLTQCMSTFASQLIDAIAQTQDDDDDGEGITNIMVSPVATSFSLFMTLFGATSTTKQCISNTLLQRSEHDENELKQQIEEIVSVLIKSNNQGNPILVNGIYLHDKYQEVEQWYTDVLKQVFHAKLQRVDFQNVAKARQEINTWMAQKTQKQIQRIVSQKPVPVDTKLALISGMVFKGLWRDLLFLSKDTAKEPFKLLDGSTVQVDMMKCNYYEDARYGSTDTYTWYEGSMDNHISMFFILPNNTDASWEDLVELTDLQPSDIRKSKQFVNLNSLWIPKLSMEYCVLLNEPLSDMEMEEAFDPSQAHFYNIVKSGNQNAGKVSIGHVVHKVRLEVNEDMTTYRSATAASEEDPTVFVDFRLDRPFAAIVCHNSDAVLLAGIIVNPELNE